ncbi:MAG TPA: DUF455 family protein [Oligoflexus sp.]|uniref:DUF455 family protein n=1 Tax=Oligoflexus sp. TaxID=1971216 RepID=UPI002D31E515|nr:DUF455 family protein [Oligoflexus sp.]HYX34840.1 DUF455 family protein [Oligoflexus sp.]
MDISLIAERLLFGNRLEDKLELPETWTDARLGPAIGIPACPGRPEALSFAPKTERVPFPQTRELVDARTRGIVLHFFANHELLAIEIMALALLRFPDSPVNFRAGLIQTIAEEQSHLRLYQRRMQELGVDLGAVPVNQFFWDCLKSMQNPLDFVIGMSLTFEQANLDFSRYYQQAFAQLGDTETAAILQTVYDDEIGHVKHGVSWLNRWKDPEESQWQAYSKRLKLPLSPARAKGPIFDIDARRRANLSEEFVEQLDVFAGSKGGKLPALHWYNADCELELARESPGYSPNQGTRKVMGELMNCMMFVAKPGDVVLAHKAPSTRWLSRMRELGFDLPEFCEQPESARELRRMIESRRWERLTPWGWTPRSLDMARIIDPSGQKPLPIDLATAGFWQNPWMELFRKSALPALRRELREHLSGDDQTLWGPQEADGALLRDMTDVLMAIARLHDQFGTPAVIKSPYGFAGSGMLRAYPGQDMSESQLGWIERQLKLYGAVLIEPWLQRIADISVVWSPDEEALSSFVFHTNAKGQYKGHSLQPVSYALDQELRSMMFAAKSGHEAAYERLLEVASIVRSKLQARGYRYAAGIDTMLYRWRDRVYLRVLGEVNCRMTMGHIARGLRKRVSPYQPSLWQTITALEAQAKGWAKLTDLASALQDQHPTRSKQNAVEKGIFFTNDPYQSQYVLGVVAVGADAIAACEGMGALSAQPTGLSDPT